jgi:DNA repair protein SbcC/Rad50
MRPIRLEMEGFTAFRKTTVIDFEGTEIFVLSGPTGSGKSSIIDAITFALYGSIPRYDDLKLVHPVISQGKLLMKVRFDFEVGGKRYTATRVVRKTGKDQATTKEARLQCGEEVLAGSAREMSDKVRELFGLDFEQFNTCIVLPQGQFARFLNEKPAKRQELLKDLLNMGIYGQIGSKAREIAATTEAALAVKEQLLAELTVYTPAVLQSEIERLQQLQGLKTTLEEHQTAFDASSTRLKKKADELSDRIAILDRLNRQKIPDPGILWESYQTAKERRAKDQTLLETAESTLEEFTQLLDQLPDPMEVKDQIHQREVLLSNLDKREKLQTRLQMTEIRRTQAETELESCQRQYQEVRQQYEESRKIHQLHAIIRDLKPGDPCPVCERELIRKPLDRSGGQPALLEKEVYQWDEKVREAEKTRTSLDAEHQSVARQIHLLVEEEEAIGSRISPDQDIDSLKNTLTEIHRQGEAIRSQKESVKVLRQNVEQARQDQERLARQIAGLWDQFDQIRDNLALLEPPVSNRQDLAGTLQNFRTWVSAKVSEQEEVVADINADLEETTLKIGSVQETMKGLLAGAGITWADDEPWQDRIVTTISECHGRILQIEEGMERQKILKQEIMAGRQEIALHKKLGLHLKANAFERWLLQEAFRNLVHDGSARLRELSSGDYSFALDESLNFDIVDHRNADEVRSSRTLSGGETFLASLALALSLADQIAELAAGGTAKLESMFLDEGFGTLDSDTLDTVAGTIETLSARGRMIGLVTHVKDLAERMPVQFRVRKGPDTSTVEKIVV